MTTISTTNTTKLLSLLSLLQNSYSGIESKLKLNISDSFENLATEEELSLMLHVNQWIVDNHLTYSPFTLSYSFKSNDPLIPYGSKVVKGDYSTLIAYLQFTLKNTEQK